MAGQGPSSLRSGESIGRYTISRVLGEGGMGTVYEAWHRDLEKRVAIKTLHRHYASSAEVRARFLREGQASSRIRHPNVVDVYDVALEGDIPYLVMEFLEGEDLSRFLAREGALSVVQAADVLLPVVSALAAAHELGVVHRDLKPENILLCNERGMIKPKVVDFGISKIVDPDEAQALTGTAAMLGTPHYMSPEQATQAENIDFRADIYSLGVVLYECLTGRKPFEEATLYTLMQRIVSGDFPPPRALLPDLPERLDQLVVRAMACDRAQRFQATREFGHALLEFGSERTRAVVAHEFGEGPRPSLSSAPPDSGAPAISDPPTPLTTSTTLGQSVHHLDSQPRPRAKRSPATLLGSGLVALAVVGGWFALGGKHQQENDASARVGAPVTGVAAARAPAALPSANVEPELSLLPDAGAELELQATGNQSARRRVSPDDTSEIRVRLEKLPKSGASPRPPPIAALPARPKLAPR